MRWKVGARINRPSNETYQPTVPGLQFHKYASLLLIIVCLYLSLYRNGNLNCILKIQISKLVPINSLIWSIKQFCLRWGCIKKFGAKIGNWGLMNDDTRNSGNLSSLYTCMMPPTTLIGNIAIAVNFLIGWDKSQQYGQRNLEKENVIRQQNK